MGSNAGMFRIVAFTRLLSEIELRSTDGERSIFAIGPDIFPRTKIL